jgi:hypothetical protein
MTITNQWMIIQPASVHFFAQAFSILLYAFTSEGAPMPK